MASSAQGIMLSATAISFINEWWDTGTPNLRIPVAGVLFSFAVGVLDDVDSQAATGLAIIIMITVLLTPFNGNSPVQTLANLAVSRPVTAVTTSPRNRVRSK